MKINSAEQVNFKSVYVQERRFNERERMLADDIEKKLLGNFKLDDEKHRTWNEWLKKEKGIDIFVKRAKDTQDKLTVFGVKNVKDFDDASKMKNFFVVGNYHTTDFKPEDVMEAYKSEKIANAIGYVFSVVLAGIILLFGTLFGKTLLSNQEINKEIPQKVIHIKDSIADSMKIAKFIKK
ncbi:hypothetical protein IKB17_07330 [bacterium]|nr:hypothetical protein [bacterium]